jgi:molecular chaperone DnaK
MSRTRIDYGIDLGTTNSAIACMKNGVPTIIKSDDDQRDTTPSCISFTKAKRLHAGVKASNAIDKDAKDLLKKDSDPSDRNAFMEFKRTMGTDRVYASSHMGEDYTSEQLSAEVLKKLKSYVRDEEIVAAAITVPAMFSQQQIEATQRAAEMAGFQYCELLQEPIAASMAYGLDAGSRNGYWLVFDFGGGTFDAALMHVDEGIIKVVDTEGNNHLGGKTIDYALIDQIVIPHLRSEYNIEKHLEDPVKRQVLKDTLKRAAESAKIELSLKDSVDLYDEQLCDDDDGEEIILDLTISLDRYEEVVSPIFQEAIDLVQELLKRNTIAGSVLETLILVGGPTFSQTLRKMLQEQVSGKLDTSIDPMTCVANGAALFAGTREMPKNLQKRDSSVIQLMLKYPGTSVETEENLGIKLLPDETDGVIPDKLFVEVTRSDKGWASGRDDIDGGVCVIPIVLEDGRSNSFAIDLYDGSGSRCPCEPNSFNIIQGLKVSSATLPFNVGLEVFSTAKGRSCFACIKGLAKNESLPAKGTESLKTQKQIRPGDASDVIRIPIYEGATDADGTRAALNNHIHDFVITGADLPHLVPQDSDVTLEIKVDESRRITASAFFEHIDETIELSIPGNKNKKVETDWLERELQKARQTQAMLDEDQSESPEAETIRRKLDKIEEILTTSGADYDAKDGAVQPLREALIALDDLQDKQEFPQLAGELRDAMTRLEQGHQVYGDERTAEQVRKLNELAEIAIEQKNLSVMRGLEKEINALDFALASQDIGLWVSFIKGYDDEFNRHQWKDRTRARQLIDRAKQSLATNPSKKQLQQIVAELFSLLPAGTDTSLVDGRDVELLRK